ncbi:UNVERIFIED_CONTAM: hypothetical protein Sradi_1836800 [Sesamum radiatum]|uniref:RNase H type-1 domain-containing protein n=1 Tax=Sesamum radiatum TaxID=300843 RepID=A0AAW2TX09_SESRA
MSRTHLNADPVRVGYWRLNINGGVWGLTSFPFGSIPRAPLDCFHWLKLVASQLDSTEFGLFLCICWTVWWSRNKKLFQGDSWTPYQVVCFATHYMDSFYLQNSDTRKPVASPSQTRWQCPPLGTIKLNFDGAALDHGNGTGVGVIARDHTGACLDWISTHQHTWASAELTEALAAREAIFLAQRRGWPSIILEGDCSSLITKLELASQDLSAVGLIVSDILMVAPLFHSCKFNFVRRDCNAVAHMLAKSGFGSSEVSSVLPSAAASLVLVDISP